MNFMWLFSIVRTLASLIKNAGVWSLLVPTLQHYGSEVAKEMLLAGKEYMQEAFSENGWTLDERKAWLKNRMLEKSEDGNYSLDERAIDGLMKILLNYLKDNPTDYLKFVNRTMLLDIARRF